MEHQAQGLVLVNGEWVSRPLDVYQILARAQQTDTEMQDTIPKPAIQAAEYGILSRTLLASPLHTYILPAKILQKDLNNIVLVGEDSIHLKEVVRGGHLRHIATKTDFNGRILTAKVFGDPREVPVAMNMTSLSSTKQTRYKKPQPLADDPAIVLPPEVIVFTLTSRTLVFLWSQNLTTGAVKFDQKAIRLPGGGSRFNKFGTHLAIDPKRRAIAVAAREGGFILYKTKTMQAWREEIAQGERTTPIQDERIISIEGCIIHMDFLSSGSGQDDFHVVLLFILAHHGKTKMTCFDWDCRHDLSRATARIERVQVDFEDHNPSLLIPLTRNLDFLLVFDTHLSAYKDVLSGVPVRTQMNIENQILSPLHPGDNRSRPRWVGWDRAPRNSEFLNESFYIAREDGRIISVEQIPSGSIGFDEAGELPTRIDTAFACLSVSSPASPQVYADVLIAGGAGNDSRLYILGAVSNEYAHVNLVESISNWTPLSDLCIKPQSTSPSDDHTNATILVTNGNHPQGEICDLRFGLRAFVDDSFSGVNGCTGLWILGYGSDLVEHEGKQCKNLSVLLVITLPLESLVINIECTQPYIRGGISDTWQEGHWNKTQILVGDGNRSPDSIIRDEETLSACFWSENLFIQITRSQVRFIRWPIFTLSDSIMFNYHMLMAASSTAYPLIAIAYHEAGGIYVEVIPALSNGTFNKSQSARFEMAHDPTCIELFDIDGISYVFVSTFDSKFFFIRVDNSGLHHVTLKEFIVDFRSNNPKILCESAAILTSRGRRLLVCTTRDGSLLYTELVFPIDETRMLKWKWIRMGNTPARISCCQTDPSAAFVSCGPDFCRIQYSANEVSDLEIASIWFTHGNRSNYSQSSVSAMSQIPYQLEGSMKQDLGGFLFTVSGDQLLFSKLDSDIKISHRVITSNSQNDAIAVPRKLSTGAKPTKILYLEPLRKVIVATMEAKEEIAPPNGYRALHSTLKLLNLYDEKFLDEPDIKPEGEDLPSNRLLVAEYNLKHSERVYSILEWPFVDHQGKKYSLLIVGTGLQVGPRREMGRRLIFNTGKTGTRLQLQKDSAYEHPVYCIAMWSNESTVSVIGKSLSFDYFDSQAGRWFKRGTTDLPSSGLHISAKPPFVYVSTLHHSHLCYEMVGAAVEGRFEFVQVFTDSRERSCTHHLVLDLPKGDQDEEKTERIVLCTDKKSASLIGLYHPPERTYKNASDTAFEACLPRTVIRLQSGDIRPPWRRPLILGTITGVLTDDIIGACSDGTLYSFSILSQSALHLLRFVQNLIQVKISRDPKLQDILVDPRSSQVFDALMSGVGRAQHDKITARTVDPRQHEHGLAGPRNKHVDGDVLVKWKDSGEDLKTLVCDGTENEVRMLFVTLARQVDKTWTFSKETEMQELLTSVKWWMCEVLMPVL